MDFYTMKMLLLLAAMATTTTAKPGYRHLRSVLGAVFDSRPPGAAQSAETVTGAAVCTGCSKKITVVDEERNYVPGSSGYTITEEEFTALRIEYIKNQILRKLRLKKKPKISMAHIPKAVSENEALLPKPYEDFVETRYVDDFYGRTTQAIVFPYEGKVEFLKKLLELTDFFV